VSRTVVLAALNARFTHSSLAIRYLRQAIEDGLVERGRMAAGEMAEDWRPELREYQINQPRLQILENLVAARPSALLLSVSIWSSALVRALLPDLRSLLPDCFIVLGGPEVSYRAAEWLEECPAVDLVVRGAGEGAVQLLGACGFEAAAARAREPGAFSGPGSKVLSLPPPPFSTVPFPYRDDDWAGLANRYVYFETSRGCPFACAYCLSSRTDQALDMKPADQACAELDRLLERRPMLVKLVDRSFNADPERARAIWRHLVARDNGETRFHFEIHPALLEEADFQALAAARPGLFQFEVGVQSVNPKPLAAIGRQVDWTAARQAIARLVDLGTVPVHLDLIIGLPGEGMAEIGRSFDEVLALAPGHFQLGFLKALPGTPIWDMSAAMGLVHQREAPYEILANRWLAPADLAELRLVEELLEATWNAAVGRERLATGAAACGGAFAFFRTAAAAARRTGYDVRTRQAAKVNAFLDDCLAALAGTGNPARSGQETT
jgi:radical SAM superfamily enzyme YgiQ (UPF0313 family)